MSVGRRLFLSLMLLIACTAILGGVAIVELLGLGRHYRAAEDQYRELRSVYEIGFRAASVRTLLNAGSTDNAAIERHLLAASQEADGLAVARHGDSDPRLDELRRSIQERLNNVGDGAGLRADINAWLGKTASLSAAAQARIVENRRLATQEFRAALVVMASALAGAVVIALVAGALQYRSVMRPLRVLDGAVARMAVARFGEQVDETGDIEFRRLIRQFNRMSGALERLHLTMREQVEIKSRQLLRSEQLAGVGCLAAGLAHEINNPLAIIAGYAQTALRKLESASDAPQRQAAADRARESLRVVCEEAFRCRDIAVQLLQLARPADREAGAVKVEPLARKAIELVRRLPVARGRQLLYRCGATPEELLCRGHTSELMQVLVNLLTNGLEACAPTGGRVVLALEREDGSVIARVTDNGLGMNAATIAQVFDPFFTDKPRRGLTGTGLGLSVSHAIVERHHGRLYAQSDGPDLGSTFTVELPVAVETTLPDGEGSDAEGPCAERIDS